MASCVDRDVEDIEDITAEERINPGKVVPKILSRKHNKKTGSICNGKLPALADSADEFKNATIQSGIPGVQSVYVKTWGCSHNSSDSEYMAGQLAAYGYKVTDTDGDNADVWLLNSCTVKNPAEDHFRNMIEAGKKKGKPVVIAGCVPQAAPRKDYMQGLSLIGVQQIDRVVEVVEETLKGNHVRLLGQKKINGKKAGGSSLDLPKIRRNPLIEIISINTGCLNACTYCKTKHARGDLGSYSIEEIVNRAKQSFDEGVVEIWLTSEDTGAYGKDIGVTLPQLLWQLVEVIPEGCMLRIGMTNPPYILEHIEEIGKILNNPRVYGFMHIPVQAGSDNTLYEMRREYTVSDFEYVVDSLRKSVPGISIATDIICGFPTETHEDFQDTIKLCKKYKFPSLFINQFFPRPGTPAAKLPQIHRQEIKKRTKELSEFFKSYEPYTDQLGKTFTILVTEISHDKAHYVGHNKYYQQVLVEMDENLMGKMFDVKIYETGKFYLKGRKLDKSNPKSPAVGARAQLGEVTGALLNHNVTNNYLMKDKSNFVMIFVVFVAIILSYIARKF